MHVPKIMLSEKLSWKLAQPFAPFCEQSRLLPCQIVIIHSTLQFPWVTAYILHQILSIFCGTIKCSSLPITVTCPVTRVRQQFIAAQTVAKMPVALYKLHLIVSILRMPIFRDFKNSRKQVFVSHQNLITVARLYWFFRPAQSAVA